MKTAIVHVAHEIPDRQPLRIAAGDEVRVGARDTEWPEFVFVTALGGSGWVPARHLSADAGTALVLTAYNTQELATRVGERLAVLEEDEQSGWSWCRAESGGEGWVPIKTLDVAS
ncbi:MAG: hypothetical protein HOV79_25705 [Hamadaea sp.]|nr:hypothetical protein [Hamadaea sp.]